MARGAEVRREVLGRDTSTADKHTCLNAFQLKTRTQKNLQGALGTDAYTRVARTTGQRGLRA